MLVVQRREALVQLGDHGRGLPRRRLALGDLLPEPEFGVVGRGLHERIGILLGQGGVALVERRLQATQAGDRVGRVLLQQAAVEGQGLVVAARQSQVAGQQALHVHVVRGQRQGAAQPGDRLLEVLSAMRHVDHATQQGQVVAVELHGLLGLRDGILELVGAGIGHGQFGDGHAPAGRRFHGTATRFDRARPVARRLGEPRTHEVDAGIAGRFAHHRVELLGGVFQLALRDQAFDGLQLGDEGIGGRSDSVHAGSDWVRKARARRARGTRHYPRRRHARREPDGAVERSVAQFPR